MYTLRTAFNWGWSPLLITIVAIFGAIFKWSAWVVAPILIAILIFGLIVAIVGARQKRLEFALQRLKQLAGYFARRFTGNSSLSIFTIIDSLFSMDNPEVWSWARACGVSQRIFNTWCGSFIDRIESDIRTRSFGVYLRTYLNELWLINDHYFEFIEQFYEVAGRFDIPSETINQYNRFVVEYNAFAQDFRESIAELRKIARTEIEPPSVKVARELVK